MCVCVCVCVIACQLCPCRLAVCLSVTVLTACFVTGSQRSPQLVKERPWVWYVQDKTEQHTTLQVRFNQPSVIFTIIVSFFFFFFVWLCLSFILWLGAFRGLNVCLSLQDLQKLFYRVKPEKRKQCIILKKYNLLTLGWTNFIHFVC